MPTAAFTQAEFNALLADDQKFIDGDIDWQEDEDHSPVVEFRVKVETQGGYPLFVRASYHPVVRALTFALVHSGVGRIYALDLGKDHRNPDGHLVGEKHKHRYTEEYRDKWAYDPQDITEPATSPIGVWQQFCLEAKIVHNGTLNPPPPVQQGWFF